MSELLEAPQAPAGVQKISRTQKDLLAGTVGGIAQVLVGQPFDMVKVRMQTSAPGTFSSALDCASRVLKNEGPLAFYKGTLTPLLGIGACVSIQFAALESAKRYFRGNKAPGQELSLPELCAAGAFAGVANTIVSGPVEHIRIRLQTQPNVTPKLYNGPLDCIKKLYAANGIAGVFKGQLSTIWRDGVGYGAYFACYEALVQRHCQKNNMARADISPIWAVAYGAAGGYALWAVIYPVDVIKSKLQTDSLDKSKAAYKGIVDCARKTWRTQGMAGFTNGLSPTLIRSPFANGATFLFFELTMRMLN
ncbi:hypothetical protein QFC20_003979 [Naganishia adeliensis]|uniref:Uncharacterized protein n=1 Tax=Naganishia adeliensis TaxID=92952 RepID=A0ACC2W4X3_9TREE|nr:hypothetical protein QFC20_003979 [Naganishia adeliensis]